MIETCFILAIGVATFMIGGASGVTIAEFSIQNQLCEIKYELKSDYDSCMEKPLSEVINEFKVKDKL